MENNKGKEKNARRGSWKWKEIKSFHEYLHKINFGDEWIDANSSFYSL